MQKSYCMNCLKEVPNDVTKCECGCKMFIFSEKGNLTRVEKGFRCQCGNDTLEPTFHMDFSDKAITNFTCTECGTQFGMEDYWRTEEGINR